MKKIPEEDENAKAWLDFVELVREFGRRRNVRVIGRYIARTLPSEERPWACTRKTRRLSRAHELPPR
jgi:hypothetical protein